jgi:hypothetical protein
LLIILHFRKVVENLDQNEGFSVGEPVGFSTLPPKGAEEQLGIENPRSFIDVVRADKLRLVKSTDDDYLC